MSDEETRSPLELLYNVSRELASALDLRTVLQRILFQSLKYVGGERGSIVVMDDNGKVVDFAIVYGRKIHDHTTQQLRETVERGLAGWVVRKRQPAWVPDTSLDERWLRRPDDATDKSGAKAALCVPLMARRTPGRGADSGSPGTRGIHQGTLQSHAGDRRPIWDRGIERPAVCRKPTAGTRDDRPGSQCGCHQRQPPYG